MDWKLILQIAGVVLGLLYLWLEYRADIRLWIVGLVMPLVHGALYYKAGLYADCSMQVYYVLAGLYGWLVWRNAPRKKPKTARNAAAAGSTDQTAGSEALTGGHNSQPDRNTTAGHSDQTACNAGPEAAQTARSAEPAAVRIGHTPLRYAAGLIAVYAAAHAGIYFLLSRFTNSTVPFWDAMTTAASIVAMWMLSRKYIEQWLVWLAVDLITIGLYLYKGIPLTAGLYALYSALAVAGYLRWRKKRPAPQSNAGEESLRRKAPPTLSNTTRVRHSRAAQRGTAPALGRRNSATITNNAVTQGTPHVAAFSYPVLFRRKGQRPKVSESLPGKKRGPQRKAPA